MEELQVAATQVAVDTQLQLKNYIMKIQQGCAIDNQGRVRALVNAREALSALSTYSVEALIDQPTEGLIMPIDYVDGCPVINGYPIWERLEGETMEAFEVFQKYLKMIQMDCPQRSVYQLSLSTKNAVAELTQLRIINHWELRAQAYDDYVVGNRRAIQLLQQRDIEDRHAKVGKELTNLAFKYLDTHTEMLTPKVAVQILEVSTKLERSTAGMSTGAEKGADSRINVNVANQIGTAASKPVTENTVVTGDLDTDRARLTQMVNIMNNIGVLVPPPEVVIDAVSED